MQNSPSLSWNSAKISLIGSQCTESEYNIGFPTGSKKCGGVCAFIYGAFSAGH